MTTTTTHQHVNTCYNPHVNHQHIRLMRDPEESDVHFISVTYETISFFIVQYRHTCAHQHNLNIPSVIDMIRMCEWCHYYQKSLCAGDLLHGCEGYQSCRRLRVDRFQFLLDSGQRDDNQLNSDENRSGSMKRAARGEETERDELFLPLFFHLHLRAKHDGNVILNTEGVSFSSQCRVWTEENKFISRHTITVQSW